MIIHKRICSDCMKEKFYCDFLKKGNRCRECTYRYQKSVRDKNPLLQWSKKNQDNKFTIKKIDYSKEILRIENE